MNPLPDRPPLDLAGLVALATAATGGPWEAILHPSWYVRNEHSGTVAFIGEGVEAHADAAFIAAANPSTVLALIARIRELEADALGSLPLPLEKQAIGGADAAPAGGPSHDTDWNGWARMGGGKKWHRVNYDSRNGTARFPCIGAMYIIDGKDVMDYRWPPPDRCARGLCADGPANPDESVWGVPGSGGEA